MKSCASKCDREMFLVPERLKGRHRGVQSEKAVEVEHRFLRNIDGWPHSVVAGLAVGHNDVEAVSRAALEDHDQALGANAGIGRAQGRAREKARQRGRADYSQRAVAKKNASSDGHKTSSQLSVLSTQN
jgi:hypothetical protein